MAAILLSASLGGGIASASTPADWYRTDLIGSQKWLTPGQGSQAVEQQPIDLHQQRSTRSTTMATKPTKPTKSTTMATTRPTTMGPTISKTRLW